MTDETSPSRTPRTARQARALADAALKDWEETWDFAMQEALQKRAEMAKAGYYVVHLEESQRRTLQQLAEGAAARDIEAMVSKLLGEAIERLAAETEV